jgi:hypothetical protein
VAHLIEVSLHRLILRTLIRELSLGRGAVGLDSLLPLVLLCCKPESDDGKHERNYEQL